MRKSFLAWTLLGVFGVASAAPVRLIFDTDAGPDFDDVGALAILHALADEGEVEILATVACNRTPLCVPAIEIVNAFYGRASLPVGVVREGGVVRDDETHVRKWPVELAKRYASDMRHRASAEVAPAVDVYRRALASAPEGSVTICAVGFLTNLADLLASKPDAISPLDGCALVRRAVKALYVMAGYRNGGCEFNVKCDAASAKAVFATWPTPLVISPAEVGNRIRTGTRVAALPDVRSPVRDVFACALAQADSAGRQSWDETAVYAAVRGGGDLFRRTRGRFAVTDEMGTNAWVDDAQGPHEMLALSVAPEVAAKALEDLMVRMPRAWSGEIAGRKMAWAHQVPWYKPENASLAADGFYNFPLTRVDERESRHASTRREMELALAQGIDGWFVDLGANPPSAPMNSSWDMQGYLDAARGTPFMVAICLDGRGTSDYFAAEIVRMMKAFGNHPNYPKMHGRPVISTYSFLHHAPRVWRETMGRVRAAGIDPYLIANANPMPRKGCAFGQIEPCLDAFDAVYMFDAPGHAKDPPEVTNRELREWCAAHGKRAVPSLHPGYWGAWLSGFNDYYHPFRGMDMLYRMCASGMAGGTVEWVHVTTWNDLGETALMPCVFTPGVTRLVRAYCDAMLERGQGVPALLNLNFAYHREELAGTLWRLEAMALPQRGGTDVVVAGELLGRDGEKVAELAPRALRGAGFVRCEWLVPTAALSAHPVLTPRLRVCEPGGACRRALLPSVHLVTGWLQNAVTVNVAFDALLPEFAPRLAVTQTNDVLSASLAFKADERVERAILFRNDRPFGVLEAEGALKAGECERVVRLDGIDGELALSVTNGCILRAVKNYERNGQRTWQWNEKGFVTRQNPKWSKHAFVAAGGADMAFGIASKGGERLDCEGLDLTTMNAAPIDVAEGRLAVRRKASRAKAGDSFWALVVTKTGRLHYTPTIWPFDAERRLEERTILETATSLETSCGGVGYALRNDAEFLTPVREMPFASNRVVRCCVPQVGARRAEWDLSRERLPYELPRRTWPHGTIRIEMSVLLTGPLAGRQSLVRQDGWSDGVQLDVTADGRVEMRRCHERGTEKGFDRALGATRLKPDTWHEVKVEGDMEEICLWIDGRRDAALKPTPLRAFDGCRVRIGVGDKGGPFRGKVGRVSIGGL